MPWLAPDEQGPPAALDPASHWCWLGASPQNADEKSVRAGAARGQQQSFGRDEDRIRTQVKLPLGTRQ